MAGLVCRVDEQEQIHWHPDFWGWGRGRVPPPPNMSALPNFAGIPQSTNSSLLIAADILARCSRRLP
jgi:hypothetical protein